MILILAKLISNWILVPSQPHRVTSQQSYSGHKQLHISQLFLYITLCEVSPQNHSANIKQNLMYTQTSNTNFQSVNPFNITPTKRARKARTCWYHWPFHLIYWYQIKEEYKKRMDTQYKIKKCYINA